MPREEPEGRPGGPGRGKRDGGEPLAVVRLPAPPGLPSGFSLGKTAQGPGIGAKGADAGRGCGGGAEPPPPSKFFVFFSFFFPNAM